MAGSGETTSSHEHEIERTDSVGELQIPFLLHILENHQVIKADL